jgi:hypothetical protein
MYDSELHSYLSERNYTLTNHEYFYICTTCPQINCVKYNVSDGSFEVWTDCNYFKFDVYCVENHED